MDAPDFRLPRGGLVDRARPLSFRFDGRGYHGCEGDTLASALLANGVFLTGRSFKYHRPRGIVGAGIEEPATMVRLVGEDHSASRPITTIRLREGLDARSINCWPSPEHDVFAVSQLFSRLLPAGFYYKTFMWPSWRAFEPLVRRAAGLAPAPSGNSAGSAFEVRHGHCDVLVVGAGPAGLMAALAAARTGARVVLVDSDWRPGGSLLAGSPPIAGIGAVDWANRIAAELDLMPDVRRLAGATAWAHREHGLVMITEHSPQAPQLTARTWRMRARRVVVATGAIERMLVFDNNDRPGVMLASAARSYVNRHAVRPGRRAVVFTNNASAYDAALDLQAAGIDVAAIIDSRKRTDPQQRERLGGIPILAGHVVTRVLGGKHVSGVRISGIAERSEQGIDCDLVCLSGGWTPTVHLFSQARGRLRYEQHIAAVVPDNGPETTCCAGAAAGIFDLQAVLDSGAQTGSRAAQELGYPPAHMDIPQAGFLPAYSIEPLWAIGSSADSPRAFVDLQNDVTSADVETRGARGLRRSRARQALHDRRHGRRPGQDRQHERDRHSR